MKLANVSVLETTQLTLHKVRAGAERSGLHCEHLTQHLELNKIVQLIQQCSSWLSSSSLA
jgi:hypothetical protein